MLLKTPEVMLGEFATNKVVAMNRMPLNMVMCQRWQVLAGYSLYLCTAAAEQVA